MITTVPAFSEGTQIARLYLLLFGKITLACSVPRCERILATVMSKAPLLPYALQHLNKCLSPPITKQAIRYKHSAVVFRSRNLLKEAHSSAFLVQGRRQSHASERTVGSRRSLKPSQPWGKVSDVVELSLATSSKMLELFICLAVLEMHVSSHKRSPDANEEMWLFSLAPPELSPAFLSSLWKISSNRSS